MLLTCLYFLIRKIISKFVFANLSANLIRNNKTTKELVSKDFKTYDIDELYPALEGSSHLLIGCRKSDFSASRIAKAVEDCDAHMLNLNVMRDESMHYDLLADIRINRISGEAVARSLERYGFDVISFSTGSSDSTDSSLQRRVDELLHYINL